jgi:hypothetical protein
MRVKKKTHPLLDMNSEALREFRQAAYELLVKANVKPNNLNQSFVNIGVHFALLNL